MEDFNGSNIDYDYNYDHNSTYIYEVEATSPIHVVLYIIIIISLPLTLLAICQLYSQVRKDHVAPIYIINLLISYMIQLCCMIGFLTPIFGNFTIMTIFVFIYIYGLMTSVCFMVCVALERYLVIAWPLWYRFRRNIKTSVVVSVVVWIFPLLYLSFVILMETNLILMGVFFLLPLPLFIFFLFGTIKALSAAISVPPDEKRRIVAILVSVLLIYTVLFLPAIIWTLAKEAARTVNFNHVFLSFISLSPLADLFLYVFSRKGAVDKFLASVCCCRMNSDRDISMTDVNVDSRSM